MLKAVIFDLDDTLYPEAMYVQSGFRAVAEALAERGAGDVEPLLNRLRQEQKMDPRFVFDRILTTLPPTGLTVRDLVERYRTHTPQINLDVDTSRVIAQIRGRYKLGLISDGWLPGQQAKIGVLGLDKMFDCICLTDQWGRAFWKPHTRAFKYVLDKLEVAPTETCYVGDNLAKDFVGPNQLGMHSIHLIREDGVYSGVQVAPGGEPQGAIYKLSQLETVLEAW